MIRVGPMIHASWDSQTTVLHYGIMMVRHGALQCISRDIEDLVDGRILDYVHYHIEQKVHVKLPYFRHRLWGKV